MSSWTDLALRTQDATSGQCTDTVLDVDYGVWISAPSSGEPAVFADSPGAQAGLKEGDIIVLVDGQRIDADHDLSAAIIPHMPGDKITLRVLNGNSAREVIVTLGTLPQQ